MNKFLIDQLNESKQLIDSLPWDNKDFYADYLAQTYYFVCHSTRLLARSISHFGVDRDFLYKRFVSHIKEENYHERIAKKDLENLGYSIEELKEHGVTKTFWESQYYKVDASKGTSLLGYILYLEGIAVHCFSKAFKDVDFAFGSNTSNFIRVHTTEDPEHLDHAIELIDGLSEAEKSDIWENFKQTKELYHQILLRIYEESTGTSRNNAA